MAPGSKSMTSCAAESESKRGARSIPRPPSGTARRSKRRKRGTLARLRRWQARSGAQASPPGGHDWLAPDGHRPRRPHQRTGGRPADHGKGGGRQSRGPCFLPTPAALGGRGLPGGQRLLCVGENPARLAGGGRPAARGQRAEEGGLYPAAPPLGGRAPLLPGWTTAGGWARTTSSYLKAARPWSTSP